MGLVGLAQFLPGVLLFLVAGHAADGHDLVIAMWAWLFPELRNADQLLSEGKEAEA